jgi:hypothetical protein
MEISRVIRERKPQGPRSFHRVTRPFLLEADMAYADADQLSKGGPNVAENVVVACSSCNSKKQAKIITLF